MGRKIRLLGLIAFLVCSSAFAAQRTDRLDLINGTTSSGRLDIYEDGDSGSNKTRFQVPAMASDITYTLPADDGDASEVLTTDGSGVLSWETAAGSGDITAVGDVISGAAFTGSQGEYLLFNGTAYGKPDYYLITSEAVGAAYEGITVYGSSGSLTNLGIETDLSGSGNIKFTAAGTQQANIGWNDSTNILKIDSVTNVIEIGDSAAASNGTYIKVDDNNEEITLKGNLYTGTVGRAGISTDRSAGITKIGDVVGNGDGTGFTINDTTQNIQVTGNILINSGTIAAGDATFNTLNVAVGSVSTSSGGTGSRGGFSLYSPIFAGTSSTGAFQSGSLGLAGHVLTSRGAGLLPTFQAASGGSITQVGDSTGPVAFNGDSGRQLIFNGTGLGYGDMTVSLEEVDASARALRVDGNSTRTIMELDGAEDTYTTFRISVDEAEKFRLDWNDSDQYAVLDSLGNNLFIGNVDNSGTAVNIEPASDSITLNGKVLINKGTSGGDATFTAFQATGGIFGTQIGKTSATDATFTAIAVTSGINATRIGNTSAADATFANIRSTNHFGPITFSNGSTNQNTPWIKMGTNTTGIAFPNAQNMGIVASGSQLMTFGPGYSYMANGTQLGWSSLISGAAYYTTGDVGLTRNAALQLRVTNGGAGTGGISAGDATFSGIVNVVQANKILVTNSSGQIITEDLNWTSSTNILSTPSDYQFNGMKIGTSSANEATFTTLRATSGIFNTRIGATSAADATFTTVSVSVGGTNTLNTVSITGGTIDGTKIGSSSAADATFATTQSTDYRAGDGTLGMTGSCVSATNFTIKDGLVTACS